ncbi:hypothetical protein GCM10007094_17510 [Pseudovibrio japonicus]|uniref:Integral membrane protein n=1 Tax=Pseudovibrio japonicus TaxID=366534 RepID=A0ABQ3E8G6_9HYPH|nr:hypothetical protein [Pseudovibrio japonicus]GHB29654.1 hypothetical protein GCM10007094_17510 [Pseudovibrio japonicus]
MFSFFLTLVAVSLFAAAISEGVYLRFKVDDYFENKRTAHIFHFLIAMLAGFAAMYYALSDFMPAASEETRAFKRLGYAISVPAAMLGYVVCNLCYELVCYLKR